MTMAALPPPNLQSLGCAYKDAAQQSTSVETYEHME